MPGLSRAVKYRAPGRIVQECGVGLCRCAGDGDRLAFAAPLLRKAGRWRRTMWR